MTERDNDRCLGMDGDLEFKCDGRPQLVSFNRIELYSCIRLLSFAVEM